jgi:hypothetical protein
MTFQLLFLCVQADQTVRLLIRKINSIQLIFQPEGWGRVVIRMELRMGAAGAILFMTSDGSASGAWSVWASRCTLWDEQARVVFWLPVGLSHLGRSHSGSSPYRFVKLQPKNLRPIRMMREGPLSERSVA